MDIKKLEKANRILVDLKKLDAEIIDIEKYAMQIANGRAKTSFTLKFEDLTKKGDDDKVDFDEDGSLILRGHRVNRADMMRNPFAFMIEMDRHIVSDKKKPVEELSYKLSDTTTLQVLGCILSEKTEIRTRMIKQLNRYGISI